MENNHSLSGKKVAVLVASGFEELAMTETQKALVQAGAKTDVISSEIGLVNGWHEDSWGHNFYVDVRVNNVLPSHYDALMIPGGARSINTLKGNAHALRIVKGMIEGGKPVAVHDDGLGMLVAAGISQGRSVTASEATRETFGQAGFSWTDGQAVVDANLISTIGGEDLPAMIEALLGQLAEADGSETEAAA